MKILYLHQYFTLPSDASGTRSYEFSKELVDNGHQVTMICATSDTGQTGVEKLEKKSVLSPNIEGIDVIEVDLSYSNSDSTCI